MSYQNYFDNIFSLSVFLLCFFAVIFTCFLNRSTKIKSEEKRNAPAWERLISFIFDILICSFGYYMITLSVEKIGIELSALINELLMVVIFWFYFAIFESSKFQATLGKMIEQIIVVDINGDRISFIRALLRSVLICISMLPFFIGILIVFFNKGRRTFHDMATNTFVVKKHE